MYLKEAYEEFKHVLLALIYDENDQTSPVANEVCHVSAVFILLGCSDTERPMFFIF